MSENTIPRRSMLRLVVGAPALAILPAAAIASPADDAENVALSAEVLRLDRMGDEITAQRIEPLEEEFANALKCKLQNGRRLSDDEPIERAFAHSRDSGREAACLEYEKIDELAYIAFTRMMAIPSKTNAGRAAKVRALLSHALRTEWRGPAQDLDWEKDQARALLGEFAGMTAEELANV